MILYKYMSFEAAKSVLKNNSLGFANPKTFNDPFELEAGYPIEGDNPLQNMLSGISNWGKRYIWADTSGVLSLTRNPLNPLMWAHYADEHKGVVIGINVKKAGFLDSQKCLIPAQFGNVIYTNTRPIHELLKNSDCEPISVGHTFHYPKGHEDKLQRLFLYKPSCWAYEEEVRIVKCLSDRDKYGVNISGKFSEIELPNKIIYGYEMPDESIEEVYFGLRHDFSSVAKFQAEINELSNKYPKVSMKKCSLSADSWKIKAEDIK
ncbi:DUF2971 domain-containing protein [Photobacterium aquimaris]|uniref:DUF2971 domain-containing protein n=1 Tax=Photobacterium aquimaris TaxID=512643 RepID=A0A1Y6KW59_9GAMM|nr:DUF2971 domain-containing protein [Photobacterium aquimaris]SMY16294.1 hypothetical protein PAQU9191_01525 [Photobacterium aquimaris]